MSSIIEEVEVDVPLRTAYNQWTQFETFPQFMDSVREVEQLDPTHVRWVVRIGPRNTSFTTGIVEQHPDELIAWRAQDGPRHSGAVTFLRVNDQRTRVTAEIDVDPQGWGETLADRSGLLARRVRKSMENFRDFLEERGVATSGWRGRVEPGNP